MNWFVYACGFIFLSTALFKEEIAHLLIKQAIYFEHPDALSIVPILLLANLFLGIFFNLSIWYKINNKTQLGALISIIGAVLTILLLTTYVPVYGFKAAAYTTLIVYFVMTLLSFIIGRYYYPVNYNILELMGLIFLAIGAYLLANTMVVEGWLMTAVYLILIGVYLLFGYRILLKTRK